MPRILVLADCDSELGDRPVMLDEATTPKALDHPRDAVRVFERVASAVAHAQEVEQRISVAYGTVPASTGSPQTASL